MYPNRSRGSWGWFSPLCLWVEKKLGDERQWLLVRRLFLAVLVVAAFLLAYVTATLPLSIEEVWSVDLGSEIIHASAFLHEDHGWVLAAAISEQPYSGWTDEIVLLDTEGRVVETLAEDIPTMTSSLVYLPGNHIPGLIVATPSSHMAGSSYVVKPDVSVFEVDVDPEAAHGEEPFSPTVIDTWGMGDGRVLVVGSSPPGRPHVTCHVYEDQLTESWNRKLLSSEPFAHIMVTPQGSPRVLAIQSQDVLVALDPEGEQVHRLNLTTLLMDEGDYPSGGATRTSIRLGDSVFGREKAGVYFRVYRKEHPQATEVRGSFFVVLGPELGVLELWRDAPASMWDPILLSDGERIATGDTCLAIEGDVAWVRRGSYAKLAADLSGDGSDEIVSTMSGRSEETRVSVFSRRGRLIASGAFPGMWGRVAAADLDKDGTREIIYHSENSLRVLEIGAQPEAARVATGLGLVLLVLALLIDVARASWPPSWPHALRRVGRILGLGTPRNRGAAGRGSGDGKAFAVRHQEYRICKCGARSPIEARSCPECGRAFRTRRQEETDLSARGWVSRTGLAVGLAGLVIHATSSAVWSVERSGFLFRLVRSIYGVISPPIYPSIASFIAMLLALAGLVLIYLERQAMLGGLLCLSSLGLCVAAYVVPFSSGFSILAFLLVGTGGFLQFAQRAISTGGNVLDPSLRCLVESLW
jgi:ribosomal protein L40E